MKIDFFHNFLLCKKTNKKGEEDEMYHKKLQEALFMKIFKNSLVFVLFFVSTILSAISIPTVTSTAVTSVDEESAYSYILTGSDPEGDPLTWSVKSGETLPAWLSLSSGIMVSTLAGSGSYGSVDGTGTAASFTKTVGVAVDANGNVYVADYSNHKIRKITPEGVVSTLAGSGTSGFADGNSTTASFSNPTGVAVDANGNVYVGDTFNYKIRKITPEGVVTTLAGSGTSGSTDGNSTVASFNYPKGVAVDASGNVYVADSSNNKIRKITPDGNVATLAGSGTSGSADGTGTEPSFNYPTGVAVDASGNVYVADYGNHKIRKITPDGNVATLAGSGTSGSADGNGTAASFEFPNGVAVDANGNVYISDKANRKIRKITSAGVVTTLAGSGNYGSVDGTGTAASFSYPFGVAADANGNVYVADSDNYKIRKITNDTTLSGTPTNADVGIHDVNLTLSDGVNIVEHNFQITVINPLAPTITSITVTSVDEDSAYSYALAGSSALGDDLNWSVVNKPDWLTFTSNSFGTVGSAGFSAGTPYYSAIVLDSNNIPYVVYVDGANGSKATVMKFSDTAWETVGSAGFSAGSVSYTSIALDSNNIPYVAYRDGANSDKATVMKFNGTAWETVGSVGFSAGTAYDISIALDSNNIPYVAYQDGAYSNKATVMNFSGTAWETVGSVGFSVGTAYDTSIALDGNNIPYVAYRDGVNSNKAMVMKFSGTAWETVGSAGFSAGTAYFISIVLDGNNIPYVAYRDGANSDKATVMKLNGSAWEIVGSAGFSAGTADFISIALDNNNLPYVVYVDGANGSKATVMKFSDTAWETVGSAGFSAGTANDTSIVLDSNNIPYVVYKDAANSYKATVMKLESTLTGTPTNAEVGIHDVNLTLSDATNTVEHNFQITVNNVNDAPTDILLSASTIAENSAIGTTIATLSTTDIDVVDTFSYSFCGGSDNSNFTISSNELKTSAVFDYESKASYSICVRTTDSGSAAFDKSFTITISDVDESQNDGTATDDTSNEGTTTNDGTTPDDTSNDGTTNNGTSNNETTIEATQAQQCVEEAIRSITFDDIKGANVLQEYIASGLNLIASKSIDCGSMEFIWSSSDSSVIDNSGVVTTGAEDKSISLTAKVIYQESQSQKSFLLTVRKTTLSDAEILKSLSFEKIKKENKNSSEILGDLELATSFMTKAITWSSVPALSISTDGTIVRGSEDTAVTLTASLGSETKEFNLIVKKVLPNDEEKAASDKAWLSYENLLGKNKDNTNIKYDLSSPLPSTAPDGSTISWSSSNLASLSNSGVVTRSANGDKHSVLTATFTRGSVEVKKEFILRILQNKPQEDTGTTFTRVEQGEKTISVLVDDKGNEKNTSVAFGADIKFETSMVEESIKQTVEFADKKLSVYLNADGTSQAQTESLDENNNAVISSVQSKIPGTQTSIDNSGKTTLSVSGSSSHINASINTDGSIEHIVVRADNQKQSRATSKIKGSSTVVSSDGSVQTASQTILDGYIVKAVVTTDSEGQSRTKFVKENINTGMQTNVENTLDESTPYEAGNVVEISEINGLLYIKTNAPLNGNLIIE